MLSINLQQIVEEINNRRNRVRYQFQELGLMLTEKLCDPRHKALYMKIAKNEEQELIMDALHYVLASPNASGNLGALFMWKLKELKDRPIQPLTLRFDTDGGYFKIGVISGVTRGDMPLLMAGINEYCGRMNIQGIEIKEVKSSVCVPQMEQFAELAKSVSNLLKEFSRTGSVQIHNYWQWVGKTKIESGIMYKGVVKLGIPVLTKVPVKRRMTSI